MLRWENGGGGGVRVHVYMVTIMLNFYFFVSRIGNKK